VERILFATAYRTGPAARVASSTSFRPRGSIGPTRSGSPLVTGTRSWPASGADATRLQCATGRRQLR